MEIIIDAMSGDNAPIEIVKGAVLASFKTKAKLVLVGDKPQIETILKGAKADTRNIDIVHTDTVVTMEDDPREVLRSKKNSSMTTGLRLLKDEGDAFISAGNTGALHVGASLIIRPIKGVQRAAIATMLPFTPPVLLLDSGANVNVTSDYLVQWAILGSIYMKGVCGVENPRIGLLNNGAEEHKGMQLQIDAFRQLRESGMNFVGNIEGSDISQSRCDVLVTDGFTGNIALKTIEGTSKLFFSELKDIFLTNVRTKLAFGGVKNELISLKKKYDSSEHGGAPLLGLQKPVIKAHGSSDARAIMNAVRQAEQYINNNVIEEMTAKVAEANNGKE